MSHQQQEEFSRLTSFRNFEVISSFHSLYQLPG